MPRKVVSKNAKVGIPNLAVVRSEALIQPYSLKLWPSVFNYLEKNGGPDFIRTAILEKLQRILDQPAPARCSDCKNLTTQDSKPFCKVLLGFLGEKKLLRQKFSVTIINLNGRVSNTHFFRNRCLLKLEVSYRRFFYKF